MFKEVYSGQANPKPGCTGISWGSCYSCCFGRPFENMGFNGEAEAERGKIDSRLVDLNVDLTYLILFNESKLAKSQILHAMLHKHKCWKGKQQYSNSQEVGLDWIRKSGAPQEGGKYAHAQHRRHASPATLHWERCGNLGSNLALRTSMFDVQDVTSNKLHFLALHHRHSSSHQCRC